MRPFRIVHLVALLSVLMCVPACRTPPLSKQEAADLFAQHPSMVRWVGYQGSDQQFHHYIVRVMDEWSYIQIRRDELSVADERPYSTKWRAPLYHYIVDPSRNYGKVEP